jgi:hypothetical protein
MNGKRIQLTLFADEQDAVLIETIRKTFNPVQYGLIKCHVTLCREDELVRLEEVMNNLAGAVHPSITVNFGKAIRFENGRGVMLPGAGENLPFHELRK